MRKFISSNVTWLYRYFDDNKSLFEIFSFLIVAQSFMYGTELNDVNRQSLNAFKIVLWVMIFLVILLLQISTAVQIHRDGNEVTGTILSGANFMKIIMRLLTLVLLLASVPIFIRQVEESVHNSLFSVVYGSLALIVLFEVLAFVVARMLPRKPK